MANQFGELMHYFPLRGDFNVTITIPRDLTPEEAKRIATWLAAMAVEGWPAKAPQPSQPDVP